MDADAGTLIAALDQAPSGMALLTDGGVVEWVNRRMCRLLRRDRDAIVGCSLGELMHPEDVDPSRLELAAHEPGRSADLGRKRFARPDGTFVWTALLLSRFTPDAPGGVPHLVANVVRPHRARARGGSSRLDRRRPRRSDRVDRRDGPRGGRQPGRPAPPRLARRTARRARPDPPALGRGRRDGRGAPARPPSGARCARLGSTHARDDGNSPRRRDPVGRGLGAPPGARRRAVRRRHLQGRVRTAAHRGRAEARGVRRPRQERVPLAHEPRAADTAALGARLRTAPPDGRPRDRTAGRGRPDPSRRTTPARPARRGPRPRARRKRPARRARGTGRRGTRDAGGGRARAAPRGRERRRHRSADRPRTPHARAR